MSESHTHAIVVREHEHLGYPKHEHRWWTVEDSNYGRTLDRDRAARGGEGLREAAERVVAAAEAATDPQPYTEAHSRLFRAIGFMAAALVASATTEPDDALERYWKQRGQDTAARGGEGLLRELRVALEREIDGRDLSDVTGELVRSIFRSALAASPTTEPGDGGLDVERLAEALHEGAWQIGMTGNLVRCVFKNKPWDECPSHDHRAEAEAILAALADPRPAGEKE